MKRVTKCGAILGYDYKSVTNWCEGPFLAFRTIGRWATAVSRDTGKPAIWTKDGLYPHFQPRPYEYPVSHQIFYLLHQIDFIDFRLLQPDFVQRGRFFSDFGIGCCCCLKSCKYYKRYYKQPDYFIPNAHVWHRYIIFFRVYKYF